MIKKNVIFIGVFLQLLSGCDLVEHRQFHDPALKLQKEDYEKITKAPLSQKCIPSFRSKCFSYPKASPLTPSMRKEVSTTLHEGVPLKSVFMELGRQVGVGIGLSLEMACERGGISYSAHKCPLLRLLKISVC